MALPTLEKTWQFNVNQSTTTSGVLLTDCRNAMLKIKQSLTGFTSGWTVVSSSNSVTASAADNWGSTITNLVWNPAGTAHSWIVLQQTGVNGSGTTQICIDLAVPSSALTYEFSYAFSPSAGFTGGSTTARPTATDEYALTNQIWFPSSAASSVVHCMQSSTGDCTRVFVLSGGICYGSMIIDTMYSDSPITYKGVFSYISNPTYSNLFVGSVIFQGIFGAIKYGAYVGVEGFYTNTLPSENGGAISDFTSGYPICPISLHSQTTSAKGRAGRLSDIYLGSTSAITGIGYPNTGTNQFVQIAGYVLPWNGSVIAIA